MGKLKKKFRISKKQKLMLLGATTLFATFGVVLSAQFTNANMEPTKYDYSYLAYARANYRYLSDLDFITDNNWSYNGWSGHNIQKDKNQEGGSLGLIVDGEKRTYTKGVSIHGRGQAIFDISELSTEFSRFIAKIGVDASRGTNGSIWFEIFVSNDGETWTSLLKTETLTGSSESIDVDLNVEGYKYLRIYVDPAGSNTADHGTIANAKFVTKDYVNTDVFYNRLHKTEYYDEIIKKHDAEYNYKNNYRSILEREFVNKIGYWEIQNLVETNPNIVELLEWILGENGILEETIEVGEISKSIVFMEVLNNLYHTYKSDLSTQNGYVFEKMMIGLAAAYSTDTVASPLIYGHVVPTYDYIARYARVKELFLNGYFKNTDWFKEYHVEFMRSIMQDALRDDETMWFSNYVRVYKNWATGPYSYMGYVKGNYILPAYFDEANRETYENKFHLSEFDVPYGDSPNARYWMVFQHGGTCWNLARTGQSIHKTIGIPSTGVFQPSHEAFLIYTKDSQNRGFWYLGNNNYGWGRSSTTWYGGKPYRLLFNWGKKSFVNHASTASAGGTNAGYQYLAQANLNRYDEYKKSLYLNLVANSYTDNEDKIDAYSKALESIEINLDSYDYLIKTYSKTPSITKQDWKKLADKIIDVYTFYPQAMYDLLKIIKPNLEGYDAIDISIKERAALERASKATNEDIWQDLAAREIANAHLGLTQANIASFSFDGANAGKIVINKAYEKYDFGWHYSLDGGKTISGQILDHSIQLSAEEISKVSAEKDIQIYIDGMPAGSPSSIIDIEEGTLPDNLYANDLENRVIGVDLTYEWRNSENDAWTKYLTASPDNTGNKTLYVRVGATGNKLPSNSGTFTFTEDNQPNTRKYVPVSHLTIDSYSTQSVDTKRPYYAPNAIDGSIYTLWHTDFRVNVLTQDQKPFITIKLDKPRYVSALEFRQTKYKANDPDFIKNARVYVSEDNQNWVKAGEIENCPQDTELRDITFQTSVYGQYVKIEMDTYNIFASLSMVNIFQDLSKNPRPTAGIGYSTTDPTNGSVVARLVNVSTNNYEILSSGGNTHTFTSNGEFTFRFVDKDTGVEGSAIAKVDWIDKIAPTGTIQYNTTKKTNKTVIATLKGNEDVIVTNNGTYQIDEDGNVVDQNGTVLKGYTVDDKGDIHDANGNFIININTFTYEFIDNGEFTFEFVDKAGNRGSAKAKVTWIDHDIPNATLEYDVKNATNKDVTVTAKFDEDVIVTNNSGSHSYTFKENGEFTFEFKDLAGNTNVVTAKVDWIDKKAPTAELKYEKYDDKVIARVVNPSKKITFQTGNGTYEYTKNGSYDIIFYDKLGNMGKVTAVITDIKDNTDDNTQNGNTGSDTNKPGNSAGSQGTNRPNNSNNQGSTVENKNPGTINSNSNQNSVNNTINNGDDSSNGSTNTGDQNSENEENANKPNDRNENNTNSSIIGTTGEDDKDVDENKSKFIYIIIILGITILAIAIVAIIVFHKKDY